MKQINACLKIFAHFVGWGTSHRELKAPWERHILSRQNVAPMELKMTRRTRFYKHIARTGLKMIAVAIALALGCGDNPKTKEGQDSIPPSELSQTKALRDAMPRPDLSHVTESALLKAVKAAQAEVEKAPESATAWGKLGHVYMVHGFRADATQCYRHAAELEPTEFRWLYYLGMSVGPTDAAMAADVFTQAIALNPKYLAAHIYAARAFRTLGRFEEAREHLEHAAELAPRSPFVPLGLGQLELHAKRFKKARDYLQRALVLDPHRSETHAALAQVYLALGDREAARRHSEKARDPGKGKQMRDPLRRAVEMAGVTKQRVFKNKERLMQKGNFERAVTEMAKLISDEEKDARIWLNYSETLIAAKRHEEAIAALVRALALTRDSEPNKTPPKLMTQIYVGLGVAYAKAGDLK
ncbi:MAG: tetratricopeptide repeat protein [Candidatus Poribacteria bacterium]|nr:tetratricopeptide repeat protein [Candidatus Poribacteria bacterium]